MSTASAFEGPMRRQKRHRLIAFVLLCSDTTAIVLAGAIAAYVRFGDLAYPVDISAAPILYWQATLGVAVIWTFALALEGVYDVERLSWGMGELSRVARALALGVVAVIVATFVLKTPGLSRAWLILDWLLSLFLVSAGRWMVRFALASVRRKGRLLRPVLIMGANTEARRLAEALRAAPSTGLVPVGCLAPSGQYACGEDVPLLGGPADVHRVIEERGIDTVVVISSAFDHVTIASIVADLRSSPIGVHISSGLFEVLTSRIYVREVAGVPLISVKGASFTRGRLLLKRTFDCILAGIIVLIGMPIWLGVAVAIRISSRGPVFYRQDRIGKDGQPFGMYKFRSMVDGAHSMRAELEGENEADGPIFKLRNDPRVTAVGRWMRKYSIDEFPQLLNVLRGEMSLVGPRPPLPSETELYTVDHWRRMEALPGMTGLWQVSGRSDLSFEEMVRLDVFYIENWSIGFDITLLVRTVPAVLLGDGAY